MTTQPRQQPGDLVSQMITIISIFRFSNQKHISHYENVPMCYQSAFGSYFEAVVLAAIICAQCISRNNRSSYPFTTPGSRVAGLD